MSTNDATRASARAMPDFNRRRFLTGAAGAATVAAVGAAAVTEPEMTPVEKLRWHVREIAELLREDGAGEPLVILCGRPLEGGYARDKSMAFFADEARVNNPNGMFGGKAVL